jgi:deoxycytidine triphosphate deaminase
MNLTGQQLIDQGVIFGPTNADNIQQHGVDLNLIEVAFISGGGAIPEKGKTILATRLPIATVTEQIGHKVLNGWDLSPGAYEITMAQGCKIPADKRLKIVHRSSLFRNGGQLNSALFDAGFETENIGTIMVLSCPLFIEFNARVGQAYTDESNTVENLYNGQWQGDKQRAVIA